MVQIDLRPHGISKPDHVSRPSHEVALQAGSRRDRTSGLSHAVKFAAVYRDFMNQQPALGASVAARGAWVSILVYASAHESEVIQGAAGWTDRVWLSAVGVTTSEVAEAVAGGLCQWINDGHDLHVLGFDHDGLAAVQSRRDNGARGGRPRTESKPAGSDPVNRIETPLLSSSSPASPPPFEYPEVFALFWAQTAKTGSKYAAHKAWTKHGRPSGTAMAAAWQAYMKSKDPVGGYVQHVSTWVSDRGWEQEWPEATNAPQASTGSAARTAYCGFHDSKFNQGKRASRHTETCPECRAWAAANRARESLPESSEQIVKRLGLDRGVG